jgi:hypothetical protein
MADPPQPATANREITFADGFVPPLPAGRYTFEAEQRLTIAREPFKAGKTVYVSAPRFVLGPGEIYSVYPPAGQSGSFHATLPHIVLTRKTLPWERSIGAAPIGGIRPPWMALLTLDDDEIAQRQIQIISVPLRQFYEPPADQFPNRRATVRKPEKMEPEPGERVGTGDTEEDHCLVARMPLALFREITSAVEDLRFLAHAREVGTEERDVADAVGDGWLAVVVGNRRPRPGIGNHGLLVSLEGFGGVLKQQRSEKLTSDPAEWVQLAVLHHWTYVAEGQNFRQLLEGLTTKDGKERDVWLRALPEAQAPAGKALDALKLGYTALTHRLRQGGRTVSWYRGPLIPMPVETGTYHAIHANADEALQYDPDTGLFNVSYSAAWQLGRLLALQNLDFASSLLHRRDGYVARGVLDEAKNMLKEGNAIEETAKLLLQDDLIAGLLTEWWMSDPANTGKTDG